MLTLVTGIGMSLVLAPLAADTFAEVEILAESYPNIYCRKAAYGQAYSLTYCAMGLGTAFGPVLAGVVYERTGWRTMENLLAIICALGGLIIFRSIGRDDSLKKRVRFESLSGSI